MAKVQGGVFGGRSGKQSVTQDSLPIALRQQGRPICRHEDSAHLMEFACFGDSAVNALRAKGERKA